MVTGVRLLQLVPAKEGPFLLLAEVRPLLEEPVGDPTLTDPWRMTTLCHSVGLVKHFFCFLFYSSVSSDQHSPVTWATTAWEIRLFARKDLISSLITLLSLLQYTATKYKTYLNLQHQRRTLVHTYSMQVAETMSKNVCRCEDVWR